MVASVTTLIGDSDKTVIWRSVDLPPATRDAASYGGRLHRNIPSACLSIAMSWPLDDLRAKPAVRVARKRTGTR